MLKMCFSADSADCEGLCGQSGRTDFVPLQMYKDILDEELLMTVETALKKRRFKGFRVDGIDIQILCHPSHRKAPRSF